MHQISKPALSRTNERMDRWANKQTQGHQKTKHSKSWVTQTKEMKGIQGQSEWMVDPNDRTNDSHNLIIHYHGNHDLRQIMIPHGHEKILNIANEMNQQKTYTLFWDICNHKRTKYLLVSFIALWLWENQEGRILTGEWCVKNPGLLIGVKSAVNFFSSRKDFIRSINAPIRSLFIA